MATDATIQSPDDVYYPDGDGQPMAETPVHRQNLTDLIAMLMAHFLLDPLVYVSGNMFLYYERNNRYRCVAPDVFLARGVDKHKYRGVYKTWEEGRGPDLVIELTSPSTKGEDLEDKFGLYRDTLQVSEYYLFDPLDEYLTPPLQGFRLVGDEYVPIAPVAGRLPSKVVGLHFEREGQRLRLYNPDTRLWLPTPVEARQQAVEAQQQAVEAQQQAEAERDRATSDRDEFATRWRQAEAEVEALRRELESLRRGHPGTS